MSVYHRQLLHFSTRLFLLRKYGTVWLLHRSSGTEKRGNWDLGFGVLCIDVHVCALCFGMGWAGAGTGRELWLFMGNGWARRDEVR